MKIRSVGVELFHADRQTDMTNLIVAFRNFANALKKPLPPPLPPTPFITHTTAILRKQLHKS